MTSALLLLLAQGLPLGPIAPPGSDGPFQQLVLAIDRKLEARDFAGAQALAADLPRNTIGIEVNWSGLSKPTPKALSNALIAAHNQFPTLQFKVVPKGGDVLVSFSKDLGKDEMNRPRYAAIFVKSGKPRVELVVRRTRQGGVALGEIDLSNEVLYGIGRYLGVAETTTPGDALHRLETPHTQAHNFGATSRSVALRNLAVTKELQGLIQKKVAVASPSPAIQLLKKSADAGTTVQGTIVPGEIVVSNTGNTPLGITVVPDCGCFGLNYQPTVAPGATQTIRYTVDTAAFAGHFHKGLTLQTNDPDQPTTRFEVTMQIDPAYRFLRLGGKPVEIVPDQGLVTEIILTKNETAPFHILGVEVAGTNAAHEVTEWSGELPDPELKEGPKLRSGYRIQLLVSPNIPSGRAPLSVLVTTDHKDFPLMTYTFQVQRGIVSLPPSLYFGELAKTAKSVPFVVSRPGKPFRIKGISSSIPSITVSAPGSSPADEFKLVARYSGKPDIGTLSGTVNIRTDDPKQPVIIVPLSGQFK